jgi:hypothetical protein
MKRGGLGLRAESIDFILHDQEVSSALSVRSNGAFSVFD